MPAHAQFYIPPDIHHLYRPFASDRFDGWIDARLFAALPEALRATPLRVAQSTDAERVREARNLTVTTTLAGRRVWVKIFRPAGAMSWLQYALRRGKAVAAWNAAFALRSQDLRSPRPLWGLRRRGRCGGAIGMLAVEDEPNSVNLDELLTANGEDQAHLLHSLGQFVGRVHTAGFLHRDLRRSNILVRDLGDHFEFALLDVNRLQRYRRLTAGLRLRELERLRLTGPAGKFFFNGYAPRAKDAQRLNHQYQRRLHIAARLESLPRPLRKVVKKLWYYSSERPTLRRFGSGAAPRGK